MGLCGDSTETTSQKQKSEQEFKQQYLPSPAEEEMLMRKNQILGMLLNKIIKPGMQGAPTSQMLWGANLANQNLREMAGKMGVQPGDPRLIQSFQQIQESLTKPNEDIAKLAMALYGGIPFLQTGTTTGASKGTMTGTATQQYSPGTLDWASLMAQMGAAAGTMGLF